MENFESWLKTRFGVNVKRDAGKVNASLKKLTDGDNVSLVSSKPAYIYIPLRFVKAGLAEIGDDIKIISQYALVIGDSYAVANKPAMCHIKPASRKRIEIYGEKYIEFSFDANSVVIENLNLFQNSTMVYYLFNEEIAKGNVPIYFNDVDFMLSLDACSEFANLNIGGDNVAMEMIISTITRSSEDLTKYHRLKPDKDYEFIALRNIQLGATNTLSKVMGSHYELGLNSGLARESDKLEDIEELLRL